MGSSRKRLFYTAEILREEGLLRVMGYYSPKSQRLEIRLIELGGEAGVELLPGEEEQVLQQAQRQHSIHVVENTKGRPKKRPPPPV